MKAKTKTGLVLGGLWMTAAGLSGVAYGKAGWMKPTKEMGLPAENCLYCHTEKMPKKDTFKVDALNDRGKWLMDEKAKRKAEIDPTWLKDYPGGKEQK